jgi:hypothetical protein
MLEKPGVKKKVSSVVNKAEKNEADPYIKSFFEKD